MIQYPVPQLAGLSVSSARRSTSSGSSGRQERFVTRSNNAGSSDPDEIAKRIRAGVSPNYEGQIDNEANLSANIPEDQNVSIWITNLPRDLRVCDLTAAIREVGRIYAIYINRPVPEKAHHLCAAKVVFFTVEAMNRFMRLYHPSGLVIRGHVAKIHKNRTKVAEPDRPDTHTRVLRFTGPSQLVDPEILGRLFRQWFEWQDDKIIRLPQPAEGQAVLEWHFSSYRNQAANAYRVVRNTEKFRLNGVVVEFIRDPCDR